MWQLQLLGGISLQRGDSGSLVTRFRTRKTAALLAYLALHRGLQPRETLLCALWPDADVDKARNNLRVALSSLRREMEPPGVPEGSVLQATRQGVELRGGALDCDALLFQKKYQGAGARSEAERVTIWRECFELYGGRLLHGYAEEWSEGLSLHLETIFVQLALDLAREYGRGGNIEGALSVLTRAARLAPQRDEFEAVARHLKQINRVTDFPLAPVAAKSLSGQTVEAEKNGTSDVALTPKTRTTSTLPLYATGFVGREDELATLRKLRKEGECCLVTLIGPLGMGKTRLAVQAARNQSIYGSEDVGRVHFVPLSLIESAAHFGEALRVALGLPAIAIGDPLQIIAQTLQNECQKAAIDSDGKRVLLLLDNLEHLLPEILPLIQTLRMRVPALQIWATSRSFLGLPGEKLVPVGSLPVPQGQETASELSAIPSVALFSERARSARAGFSITHSNAASVGRLCRQLEGWPFAIELAAARSHSFTPQQMEEQIRQSHDFLQRHSRRSDADARRHSSLEAAIRWSYDLLENETAQFFRSLCVFRGGVTVGMAQRATGEARSLVFLSQLLHHSLVTCEERGGELRYGLLEGVRQFLRTQSNEVQWNALRQSQADAFAAWLTESQHWTGESAPLWLECLDAERENGRAALEWAREHNSPLLARLGSHLWRYFDARGLVHEGRQWLTLALECHDLGEERIALENGLSRLCFRAGEFETGLQACQRAADAAGSCHDEIGTATAKLHEGIIRIYQGQVPTASQSLETAHQLFARHPQALGNEALSGEAQTLVYLGVVKLLENALDESFRIYQEAIQKAREAGDWNVLALSFFQCGEVLGPVGRRYEEARHYFSESLHHARRVNDTIVELYALWGLCRVALWENDLATAQKLLEQIDEIVRQAGLVWCAVFVIEIGAFVAAQTGDWRRVALLLGAAQAAREAMTFPLIAAYYVEFEKQFAPLWQHIEPQELARLWARGRSLTPGQSLEIVRGGDISSLGGSEASPAPNFPFPMGFPLEKTTALPFLAQAYEGSGRLAAMQNDSSSARQFLRQALDIYLQLPMAEDASRVRSTLKKLPH